MRTHLNVLGPAQSFMYAVQGYLNFCVFALKGTFEWIDGSPFLSDGWRDTSSTEDFIQMVVPDGDGEPFWDEAPCDSEAPFLRRVTGMTVSVFMTQCFMPPPSPHQHLAGESGWRKRSTTVA